MRIIAGKFKGKRINSPKTINTRPTLDRVKEAVFSMLDNKLSGACVLDLFGGTGAQAIEAISRGASFAYINDNNNEAISVICKNVALTDCSKCVKITKREYGKCLKQLVEKGISFDCIFIDPPYDLGVEKEVLNTIVEGKLLKNGGLVVLEGDKKKQMDENIKGLEIIKKKTYGRVIIRIYKLEEE